MNITLIVDTAVVVPANIAPLLDDTDFKTRETAVAYNASGMDLVWNFLTTAGVMSQTAVTPTTAGVYDWTHLGDGMYSMEIPASGGASINNDTEGWGWFSGVATGVLPWRGPTICFAPSHVVNGLVAGSDNLQVDQVQLGGSTQSATDLKDFADDGYDPSTNKVQGVVLTDTVTTLTNLPAITANWLTAAGTAADFGTEMRTVLHGGDWAADMDANGRHRIVDGTGVGEFDSLSGTVLLRAATQASIDAIELDTNELQTDWANGGRLDLILDARASQTSVDTIDGIVDTLTAHQRYAGPRGPGIYYNDAAANTSTTLGTDGTYNNPISSAAAAVTLAGSLGAKRIYLINDSTLTLGASMADYEFVGIGFRTNNIVSLNGQSVTQAAFYNLGLTGAPANSGQFACFDCIFGAAMTLAVSTTILAVRCQLSSSMSLDGTTLDLVDCNCVGTTTTTMTFRSGIGNNSAVRAVRCSIDSLVVAGMADTDTPDSLLLSGGNGDVTLQASCVGGAAEIHGDWRITDSSAGTTVTDHTTYTTLALIESQTDDIGVAGAGLTAILDRLPAALVSGRMDCSVGAMAANVMTAAASAADLIAEIQAAITGGAYDLDTDANGRIRIVDGTGTGEIDTASGLVRLSSTGVDDIWDEVVQGAYTARQSLRLQNAAAGGKLSGAATTNILIRNLSDTLNAIDATVDSSGNRSAVTLDLSA